MGQVVVGIAGWTYAPWRGNFYPKGLVQGKELAFASRRFGALEINGTFYSMQKPSSFAAWREQTPREEGFVFTMKGGKFITHERMLKDAKGPLANFLASGLLSLKEKLGPILWQLPPFLRFDAGRVREFFELLPRDTVELAKLAMQHDSWMDGRVDLEPDARRPVRHALEFRHESFRTEEFAILCREFNVSMVMADAASKFPSAEDVTADWVYLRLHGERENHAPGYTAAEIDEWAKKIQVLRDGGEPEVGKGRLVAEPMGGGGGAKGGRDVYVLFDSTEKKTLSPLNARAMAERLGVGPMETAEEVMAGLGVKGGKEADKPKKPAKAKSTTKEREKTRKPVARRGR